MFVEFAMLCGFSSPVNSWATNWGATCVDDDTSRHTCYPHRGWAALKEAWLSCQVSCEEKERGRSAERKPGKGKLLRVQKASGRKDSSFTWPPWSFHCCYLEHKHWHGIPRIWKFIHIGQHQPISCRPRCSSHPWAPCGGVEKPELQKGGEKEQNKREVEPVITSSYKSSVFLTPVISTQSTRIGKASLNWSLWDTGHCLQIRYRHIDIFFLFSLLEAVNGFVSQQTQQIFHPGFAGG